MAFLNLICTLFVFVSGCLAATVESDIVELTMSQTGDTVEAFCKVSLSNYKQLVQISSCQLMALFPSTGAYPVCSSTYVTWCTQTQSSSMQTNFGDCSIKLKLAPGSFGRGYRFYCDMSFLASLGGDNFPFSDSLSSTETFFIASKTFTTSQSTNSEENSATSVWWLCLIPIAVLALFAACCYKRRSHARKKQRQRNSANPSITGTSTFNIAAESPSNETRPTTTSTPRSYQGNMRREEPPPAYETPNRYIARHLNLQWPSQLHELDHDNLMIRALALLNEEVPLERCVSCGETITLRNLTERVGDCNHIMHYECYHHSLFVHVENGSAQPFQCPACQVAPVSTQAPRTEQNQCTICLEELQIGEQQVTLPCLCKFHLRCVQGYVNNGAGHVNQCSNCTNPFTEALISDGHRTVGELMLIDNGQGMFQTRTNYF